MTCNPLSPLNWAMLLITTIIWHLFINHRWNYVRDFFDERFPLLKSSWKEVSKITIEENKLVFLSKSGKDLLKNSNQFIGFNGDKENPDSILLKNNNLHIDILLDSKTLVGKIDTASILM